MSALSHMDTNSYIVLVSVLLALFVFAGFAAQLVSRSKRRDRYKEVVEKKRRTLYDQAREQANKKSGPKSKEKTAAQSMAGLYKLQSLAGEASVKARSLMLQAGIRSTSAPLFYLGSRVLLPVFLIAWAMLLMGLSHKEVSHGVKLLALMGCAVVGFFLPRILIKNMADKRQMEISLSFPDALDMLLICVQGGIGIEAAINRIGQTIAEHSDVLAEELGILSAELGMLNDRKAAFQGFAGRVGSGPARSFATAMLQAEQYGTSISKAIRVLSDESREERMARAEQKAASLPPKLTVPMILFFLPPLFVIILGPAFLSLPGH